MVKLACVNFPQFRMFLW